MVTSSFNRNIVECKVVTIYDPIMQQLGFNRNIVECKANTHGNCLESSTYVLIETLWNVKCDRMLYGVVRSPVLIETLWNVKTYPHNR